MPDAHAHRTPRPVWLTEGRGMRDERTEEDQRGEGGVDAEGGGQLLDALSADIIPCVQRSAMWTCGVCAAHMHAIPTARVADRGTADVADVG